MDSEREQPQPHEHEQTPPHTPTGVVPPLRHIPRTDSPGWTPRSTTSMSSPFSPRRPWIFSPPPTLRNPPDTERGDITSGTFRRENLEAPHSHTSAQQRPLPYTEKLSIPGIDASFLMRFLGVTVPHLIFAAVLNVLIALKYLPELNSSIDGSLNGKEAGFVDDAMMLVTLLLNYVTLLLAHWISVKLNVCHDGRKFNFTGTKATLIFAMNGIKCGISSFMMTLLQRRLTTLSSQIVSESIAVFLTALLHAKFVGVINNAYRCYFLDDGQQDVMPAAAREQPSQADGRCLSVVKAGARVVWEFSRLVISWDAILNNVAAAVVFYFNRRALTQPDYVAAGWLDSAKITGELLVGDVVATLCTIYLLRKQEPNLSDLWWRYWATIGVSSIFVNFGFRAMGFNLAQKLGLPAAIGGILIGTAFGIGNTLGLVNIFRSAQEYTTFKLRQPVADPTARRLSYAQADTSQAPLLAAEQPRSASWWRRCCCPSAT